MKWILVIVLIVVTAKAIVKPGDDDGELDKNAIVVEFNEESRVATLDEYVAMTDEQRNQVKVVQDESGKYHNILRSTGADRIPYDFHKLWILYAGAANLDGSSKAVTCQKIRHALKRTITIETGNNGTEVYQAQKDFSKKFFLDKYLRVKNLPVDELLALTIAGASVDPLTCYNDWGGIIPRDKVTYHSTLFSGTTKIKAGGKVQTIPNAGLDSLKRSGFNLVKGKI